MNWQFTIFQTNRVRLVLCWLPFAPERPQYHKGHLRGMVRPFIEIGIDNDTVEKIVYIGVYRFVVRYHYRPKEYIPSWSHKPLPSNVIDMKKYRKIR